MTIPVRMSPPASGDDSNPRPLNSTLRNNTLRRCWGALKETVDALGAAWDAYDNDAEASEANTSCRSDARPPSTPTSPKRPSLDIFETPPSRPAHESAKSYRTHYDTLTDSPTTSKSSRRKRKTNPRCSNPTPTRRRNQNVGIDKCCHRSLDIFINSSAVIVGTIPSWRMRSIAACVCRRTNSSKLKAASSSASIVSKPAYFANIAQTRGIDFKIRGLVG